MSRPLLVTDCDEVLLYMVAHFKAWLEEGQGVSFNMVGNDFGESMRWKESGRPKLQLITLSDTKV